MELRCRFPEGLVAGGLMLLTRRCSANSVRLFVDAAVDDDIQRDRDLARRMVTRSKLDKFDRLRGIKCPDDAKLARSFGTINSPGENLKLSTFKMGQAYRGEKFGEQPLKQWQDHSE